MGTSGSRGKGYSPKSGNWSRAKGSVTRFTKGPSTSVGTAVGNFVSAIGARQAVRRGGGGRGGVGGLAPSVRVGQRLGAFLGGVASEGLEATLTQSALSHLIGATAGEVIAGVVDVICGDGALLDDAVARSALSKVLGEICQDPDERWSELRDRWNEQIGAAILQKLISEFLIQVIYQRFLVDLGERIEANAISVSEAAHKEKQIYEWIKQNVKFEFGEIDFVNFDWQGAPGREFIQGHLAAAIAQMEG